MDFLSSGSYLAHNDGTTTSPETVAARDYLPHFPLERFVVNRRPAGRPAG
jgi:hypothetical protein